jgi:hypothetical protein
MSRTYEFTGYSSYNSREKSSLSRIHHGHWQKLRSGKHYETAVEGIYNQVINYLHEKLILVIAVDGLKPRSWISQPQYNKVVDDRRCVQLCRRYKITSH